MIRTVPIMLLAMLFSLECAISIAANPPSPAQPPVQGRDLIENPVKPIVAAMRDAEQRLRTRQPGKSAREPQQRALDEIQKLIDEAGQGDASPPPPSSAEPPKQQQGNPQPQQPRPADPSAGQTGANRTAQSSRTQAGELPTRSSNLVRDVWGHLPPAVRQQFRADFSETTLPAYDPLIRRYFEALIDQSTQKREP